MMVNMKKIKRNKRPEITVVIPTYNHARLLERALKSLTEQTFHNWEAIVVNNYSNDDTEDVVKNFNDPRIILTNHKNFGVIGSSRNLGIKLARAEYISFLDSDDEWFPKKLEVVKKYIDKGFPIICHGESWVRQDTEIKRVFYGPATRCSYRSLLYFGNRVSTSAMTVSKRSLTEVGCFSVRPEFSMVEDYDLWMKLSKAGNQFLFLPKILGKYHIHSNNNSSAHYQHTKAELALLRDHFSKISQRKFYDVFLSRMRIARVFIRFVFVKLWS